MTVEEGDAPLTLARAVEQIDRATGFAEPLRRRAEGVTIALWGLVSACIVLSNGILDDVYGFWDAGGWRRLVSSLLWVPWAGIGVLATMAVWRIAEIGARRAIPGRRRSPGAILAWVAALLAMVVLVGVVAPVGAPGIAIALVGVAWAAVGALDLYQATRAGRRTLIVVGLAIVLAGAAYGWLGAATGLGGWGPFEIAAVIALGLVPLAGGLAQALRG